MKDQFHPAADWPCPVPEITQQLDAQTPRQDAYSRVVQDLPVAAQLYAVRDWLHTAPLTGLLDELLHCMVAADCWAIRFACPRSGFAGSAWNRYWMARLETIRPLLSTVLARWAVLEQIPTRWIPEKQIQAELSSKVTVFGFLGEVGALQLIPPVSGGLEWVERDGGRDITTLLNHARQSPVAAILHWPDRTTAAIVTAVDDQLKAFGTAFGPEGFLFNAEDLAGSTVVSPAEPPTTWLYRCTRALGLHYLVWRWIRYVRLQKGRQRLASI